MKIFLLLIFILFCFTNIFSNEYSQDFIEYQKGKGIFKNNIKLTKDKEIIKELEPVPEAVNLFKKSQGKFAVSFTFLGVGLCVGITEIIIPFVFNNYNFTASQDLLYQAGMSLLSVVDAASLVLFVTFLIVGIVQRYNSFLLYNTNILKLKNIPISLKPNLEINDKTINIGLKFYL